MPFFKHFGMVTLPDASVDVEDERQPAAQMPYPARQNPVSSWEAVGELVHRYLCHPRGSHHQGDGTREPRLPNPFLSRPSRSINTSASARAPLGIGSQGFPRGGGGGRPAFPLRTPRGTVLPRHFPTFPGVSVLVPLDLPGCAGPRRPLRAAAGRAGGAPGDVRRHRHCGEDGEAAQIPPGALG